MTCTKQEFCIHEKYCKRHIGQNFDSCILFSRNSKPMTEQEHIQTATTEQLAEWLQEHMDCASCGCNKDLCYQGYDCCKLAFVEWLKEVHHD